MAHPEPLSALSQEFLIWHNRLQHLPMTTMLALSKLGILPRRFQHTKSNQPICASCLFVTAHRRPWRTKSKAGTILRASDDKPGRGVSTDQLVSAQAGLITQFSGHLTRSRIWGATISVDHFSDHVHVHLMRSASQDKTLTAKRAYERLVATHKVTIWQYHADNGRFAEKAFCAAVNDANQSISYCGVVLPNGDFVRRRQTFVCSLGCERLVL